MENRNAELDEYLRAFEGLEYPTSRSAVINRAADTGGLDTEVLLTLERLPDRTYDSRDDLLQEVERAYAPGPAGAAPAAAAPSGLTDGGKNLGKAMAAPKRGEPFTHDGDEGDTDRRALT